LTAGIVDKGTRNNAVISLNERRSTQQQQHSESLQ
jgi:hypothetical protein